LDDRDGRELTPAAPHEYKSCGRRSGLVGILQRMHVPSRLLVWPDAWHWILKPEDSRHFYEEVHAWLATYLKGEAPTTR
jgi:hypothetical protein